MKNNRILMIGAGLALVLAMFAGCGGRSGEKEYEKGVKAWEKGNLVQARALFEKASARLTGNEKKSRAFNKLGLILWELNEPEAAADAFGSACELSDKITDARLNLAVAQYYSGDLDGATVSLSMYLGENPANKTALAMQSLIAADKLDWAQSARVMAEAAALDPEDPAAQNALALAELNHGQGSARAIQRLQRVLTLQPDYAPAIYNLAVIHDLWLRDNSAAAGYYEDYLARAGAEGSHAEAARAAMNRLSGPGGAATAAATADAAAALRYMNEGARLHGEKQYAQAVVQFQKAIDADPSQEKAYYNMGLASFYLKEYSKAGQAFEQALVINPSYADARYMLSYCLLQQKKWDAAEREARALASVDRKRSDDMLRHIESERP